VIADEASPAKNNQDRRTRLLDAAILEFSQRGLAGARIDSIAKAAGVNKQLLYHYFGDKAQLDRAVMAEVIRRQDEDNAAHRRIGSFKDHLARRYNEWTATSFGRISLRLLTWEALEHGAEDIVLLEERRKLFDETIAASVRDAQASGEVDASLDAGMLALALVAMELLPAVLPNITRLITGYNGDEPEFSERYAATLEAVVARLASNGPPDSAANNGTPSGA
jgi:TetR/AcrR family transcriptional regulator